MDRARQRDWLKRLLEGIGTSRATVPSGPDPGYPFEGFLGNPERAQYVFIGTNPGGQKPPWHSQTSLDDHLRLRQHYFSFPEALQEWRYVWNWYLPPLAHIDIKPSDGLARLNEVAIVTNISHLPTSGEAALRECPAYLAALEKSWPLTQELLLAVPARRWVVQGNFAWTYIRRWLGLKNRDDKPFPVSAVTPGPNPRHVQILRTQNLTAMKPGMPSRQARAKANYTLSDWSWPCGE